jgi:hypothetical protein
VITEQNKTKWITAKKKRTNIIPKLTARLTVSEPIDHLKLQACTTSKRNNHQSLVSHSPNDKLTILLFTCITNRIYGHVTTELRSRPSYTHTLFAVQSELYDFHPVIILLTLVFFFCVVTQNCPFMAHSPQSWRLISGWLHNSALILSLFTGDHRRGMDW